MLPELKIDVVKGSTYQNPALQADKIFAFWYPGLTSQGYENQIPFGIKCINKS